MMTIDEMRLAVCEKLPGLIYHWQTSDGANHETHFAWREAPYPNRDIIHWPTEGLAVCHEAEKLLDYEDWQMYIQDLQEITLRDKNRKWITPHNHDTATYEQRLEALCRVWFPERFQ